MFSKYPIFNFFPYNLLIPLLQIHQPTSVVNIVTTFRMKYGRIGFLIHGVGEDFFSLLAADPLKFHLLGVPGTQPAYDKCMEQAANDSSHYSKGKGKVIPLQARCGLEGG